MSHNDLMNDISSLSVTIVLNRREMSLPVQGQALFDRHGILWNDLSNITE